MATPDSGDEPFPTRFFAQALGLRLRRVARAAGRAGQGLLGLALPPTCIACGRITGDAGGLCGTCWGALAFITPPCCERTGVPFPHALATAGAPAVPRYSAEAIDSPPAFDRARAVALFTDVARDLVHNLKYADRLDVAAPMARMMALAGRELIADADLIVPVPLHAVRLWRRRFNQAALLARHLAPTDGPPVRADLLRRRRATSSQTRLGRQARRANVADAFAPCGDAASVLPGQRVLLVDDVYTTGATLDACARVLRRAGAAHVDALTFARVVDFP
ncbi:ComF family protein [Xanthobacter sp. V4C-4]|uniref:ComF family protein n=1 Tax=Xanthobacter cornucopiae TaxID=3119924 RepID=UPI0037274ACC